jgi:hypothetical protein
MTPADWTVAALDLRAAYIVEHAAAIYVRVETVVGLGRYQTYALSELHGTQAIREAFRLLLRQEMPHGKIIPGATSDQGGRLPAAGGRDSDS